MTWSLHRNTGTPSRQWAMYLVLQVIYFLFLVCWNTLLVVIVTNVKRYVGGTTATPNKLLCILCKKCILKNMFCTIINVL